MVLCTGVYIFRHYSNKLSLQSASAHNVVTAQRWQCHNYLAVHPGGKIVSCLKLTCLWPAGCSLQEHDTEDDDETESMRMMWRMMLKIAILDYPPGLEPLYNCVGPAFFLHLPNLNPQEIKLWSYFVSNTIKVSYLLFHLSSCFCLLGSNHLKNLQKKKHVNKNTMFETI